MKTIDKLPIGPGWTCEIIELAGDQVVEDGSTLVEDLELWRWDPVECVNELMGNPAFKEYISYVPERVYTDDTGQDRIYDEMWTADWWWETQVSWSFNQEKKNIALSVGSPTGQTSHWGNDRPRNSRLWQNTVIPLSRRQICMAFIP